MHQILTLPDSLKEETQDDREGKMLLHTEYSLLSLLHDQDGVVHHHGLLKVCFKFSVIKKNCQMHCNVYNVYSTLIANLNDFYPKDDSKLNINLLIK